MKKSAVLRLAVLGLLATGIAASLFVLPIRQYLTEFRDWIATLGAWGPVLLAAIYIPGALLFFPGSILTLSAGFAFGLGAGLCAVSVGSTLGAAAAFLVGRFLARDWVQSKVSASPRFQAIDRAVGEKGFQIVFLTRLSPVFPFTLLNYAYGLTGVKFWHYFLASWVGMLPGALMYIYLGSAAGSLAEFEAPGRERTPAEKAFFFLGLAATIAVTVYITRLAKRALDRAIAEPNAPSPKSPVTDHDKPVASSPLG